MTPTSELRFSAGTKLDVKVTKKGFGAFTRSVVAHDGHVLKVRATLEPAKE